MKKILSLCLTALCVVSLFSGCNEKKETDGGNAPAEIMIFRTDGGRIFTEDNPVIVEVEKRTNTKIDMNLVKSADAVSKYSILVASGDIPDISMLPGFNHFQFVNQDLYVELEPLLEKHGQNITKVLSNQEDWDLLKTNGKQYAIPYSNTPGKNLLVARKDWMDTLNIEPPVTLEEYIDMIRRFATDDPDGNGKRDTYGITTQNETDFYVAFMHIYGAFGVQPQTYFIRDNNVYPSSTTSEYKQVLELLAELYKDKIIDPEIFLHKQDQARQKIVLGKSGSLSAWWSLVPQVLTEQLKMKEINPDADWIILDPPVGKDGASGMRPAEIISSSIAIAKDSKNQIPAMRFLDFLATDDGWDLVNYGLEGIHYTTIGNRTPEGDKGFKEKWLDVLSQTLWNVERQNKDWKENTPENWKYIEKAMNSKLYKNDFYGIITDDYNTLYPDIKKLEDEWLIKFVSGEVPLSRFSEYVAQWNQKGGEQMMQSMVKEYNVRNNTNIVYEAGKE